MNIKNYIRTIPDFPQKGIFFRDITPLLNNVDANDFVLKKLVEVCSSLDVDKIVGIESRGFLFGYALADRLGVPFVPARKQGKLPFTTLKECYKLEYGIACIEIHTDAIKVNERVIIVDDLLATGGTMSAVENLIKKFDAKTILNIAIIELVDLNGKNKLKAPFHSLIQF